MRPPTPTIETLWDESFQNCNPDNCVTTEVSISESKTRTHKVTVASKVEVGVEIAANVNKIVALFAELKAKAHASVEFSGAYSTSWVQTFTIEVSSPLLPCKTTRYLKQIKHYASRGTQDYAEHRGVCREVNPDCPQDCFDYEWFCNFETLSGVGDGYTSHINGWFQAESCEDLGEPCDCLPVPQE